MSDSQSHEDSAPNEESAPHKDGASNNESAPQKDSGKHGDVVDHREPREAKRTPTAGSPECPIDFSPSSGAVDPEHAAQDTDTDYFTERYGYTENATAIGGELDADSDKWISLNQANQDFYQNEDVAIGSAQKRFDQATEITAWGRQIGLTKHECRRAVTMAMQGNWEVRNKHGNEAFGLAALTLAANEAHGGPETAKVLREEHGVAEEGDPLVEAYTEIRESLDVDPNKVKRVRKHLRNV